MNRLLRLPGATSVVAAFAFSVFILPMALFLYRFRVDAPFYFIAQDSFYYLSIALHSARTPFFSIDGIHPTNGFHPLWEWLEFALSKLTFFRLDGPQVLPRFFGLDLALVGTAVALLAAYVYRITRRPLLSILAFCPGLLWLLVGIGAPAYLNLWASVNGMETGLELLFFSICLWLFGLEFPSGWRLVLATAALGGLVLARLDDVFFLLAFIASAFFRPAASPRLRRLLPFALPLLMIAAYVLYNHITVGVWMPVSGAAKVGKGYRAGIGESLRLLEGWPFFRLEPSTVAFFFSNVYVMVAQMFAPMAIAAAWLLLSRRSRTGLLSSPTLQAITGGTLLKGAYNFLRVPIGFQGAWYYGASIATADIVLSIFAAEILHRWAAKVAPPHNGLPPRNDLPPHNGLPPRNKLSTGARGLSRAFGAMAVAVLAFLSFNVVASRASGNGFAATRDGWLERATLRAALQTATSAPFLEFQDGELSFATGLPSVSGFGLAADPASARAQHNGTYFDLLARRGITVAAASNSYPPFFLDADGTRKALIVWGFNPQEVQHYCFEPFWTDPRGNLVLYHIRHQAICPGRGSPGY